MNPSYQKNISSIESLSSTIQNDSSTLRWFTFLIVQQKIKTQLCEHKNNEAKYASFKGLLLAQNLISISALTIALIAFLQKNIILTGALIAGVISCVILHHKAKEIIAELSVQLLKRDFPEGSLNTKTLFQISEHYSRVLSIPSLVDTITQIDIYSRNIIIAMVAITGIIYTLKLSTILLSVIAAYYFGQALLNTSLIYKKLK